MKARQWTVALCGLAAGLCLGTSVGAEVVAVQGTLLEDRWQYPFNFSPTTREKGAIYVIDAPQFQFNKRDGLFIVKFAVTVPEELQGKPFRVKSARVRYWEPKTSAWEFGGTNSFGHPMRLELFAARFGPTFDEATWTKTSPYIGSDNATFRVRDPYPADLQTDMRVEDNVTPYDPDSAPAGYTPWSLGLPVGYAPGAMTDSFPVDFHLNANDPAIQAELMADLASGFSSWFFSSTFARTGGPGVPSAPNPEVIQVAGLANTTFGTSQQAPSLRMELERLYEVDATLLNDRWYYPFNGTPGSRPNGSLFLSLQEEFAIFNTRDGQNLYKFALALPPELEGKEFEVVQASMTVWSSKSAGWQVGSLNELGFIEQIEAFPARFGPTYDEASWMGTEAFIGGTLAGLADRDPYPADLRTGERVEQNVTPYDPDTAPDGYTPWGVGVPIGYTPDAMTDAFPIVVDLDATHPTIQQELQEQFGRGTSSWFLSSTYDLQFGGEPPATSIIPDLIMSEGVGNINFGTSQQAPKLQFLLREVPPTPPVDADTWGIF